ncbi:MAG TPA: nickel insertion protein, partial [Bacteroidales bacterium]|nr:nickel insertion protein [Bacteroidales bacterium]
GHKQSEFPNVLRVFTVEMDELPDQGPGHSMLECNIDDMTPEQISYVMERLFEAGADDVFITPIIMKKSRNASKLSVLCDDEHFAEISSLLVSETSTLGFRTYIVDKTELEREFSELKTKYGMVRIKNGFFREQKIRQKPEYEDCARLAREHKVPLSEIYREVDRVLNGNG